MYKRLKIKLFLPLNIVINSILFPREIFIPLEASWNMARRSGQMMCAKKSLIFKHFLGVKNVPMLK